MSKKNVIDTFFPKTLLDNRLQIHIYNTVSTVML